MAKLVDALIDEVRESTENEEFDSTVGLTEEEILKFLNHAQYRLHNKIVAKHQHVFDEEEEVNTTADTESYDISYLAHLDNRIVSVEYTSTGNSDDYYPLQKMSVHNRYTGADGYPCKYFVRNKKIYLRPTPTDSNGKLRISFVRKIKALDKRRGQIKAVTTSGSNITNLEINYVNGTTVDSTELAKRTRVCVVDKYGAIKMKNILLESISSSVTYDATLDIDASFAFESSETIAVDDYIVSGEYATTHSEVEPEVERYLQAYAEWKILKRDSSVDSEEAVQELQAMEQEIIDSYADLSEDIIHIPIINEEDDWGF